MNLKSSSSKSNIRSLGHSRNLTQTLRLILSRALEPQDYDSSLYSHILQLCTESKSLKPGRSIHCRIIIAHWSSSDTALTNRLIIFYSKAGDLGTARKLFDRMRDRNVVTWTSLISGHSQNENYEEALSVFANMRCEGVKGNQFTYGSALSACTRSSCLSYGLQVQGCVEKSRFASNMFVQSALVDFHAKCGKIEDAHLVFDKMESRDLVSWNAMIGGYAYRGMGDESISVFCSMLREGVVPDSFSFGSVLRASIYSQGLARISIIHAYILTFGFRSHEFLNGSLIDAYVKCGNLTLAHRVYNDMHNKDVVSLTSLISGYSCDPTNCTKALSLFKEAQSKMPSDAMLLCSMLNICAKTASLNVGRQLHANAIKTHDHQHDPAMCNALIDMYSKSGVIHDAVHMFEATKEKNIVTWTSLISGYGKNGLGDEAIRISEEMEREGIDPNEVTLLCLIFACGHNNTSLASKGLGYICDLIRKHGISLRNEHFSCFMDLLARGGHLEEAYELVRAMPVDCSRDGFASILGACGVYGDRGLGSVVGRRLCEFEPRNAANYVTLSGVYAASGLWDRVGDVRRLMREKAELKFPGCSS